MQKFYDTKVLTLDKKKKLLNEAKSKALAVRVEELDCSKSWARQSSDISVNEMLEKHLDDSSHFVVIKRDVSFLDKEDYFEIGFSTMKTPSLFLFIFLNLEQGKLIVDDYSLTEL